MTNRDDNVDKVVGGVETAERADDVNGHNAVELSSGVVLTIRPVPRHFMYEVTRRFERPRPPRIFNEDKGREEENRGDPRYAEALENYLADISNAATDVALLRGTEIEHIPDGMPGPDSEQFREEGEILRLAMMENARARYLHWIKLIAAPVTEDINELLGEIGQLTGVPESDVEDAVRRFRSLTERGEDRPDTVE